MKLYEAVARKSVRKTIGFATGALLAGALGVTAIAGAQDERPPAPENGYKDHPQARPMDREDRPALRGDNERHAYRRGDGEFGRGERKEGRRDGFGPGPDGQGPQGRREGGERAHRQGPPPQGDFNRGPQGPGPERGEFGRGRDGRGPGPDGFGPPPRRESGQDGFRQGPPPRGEFGYAPNERGPRPPMSPPSFEAFDTDGDGSISKAEFDAFHENHRPGPPPQMREGMGPRRGGRPEGPGAPGMPSAPVAPAEPLPPAPPAE